MVKDMKLQFELDCQKEVVSQVIHKIINEITAVDPEIQDIEFRVEMAAREMLANAIEHGCKTQEQFIQVELKVSSSEVYLKVIDPGEGFDWENADFSIPLLNERGRGLGMIKEAADRIKFNKVGNIITAYFCN
ncbi:MAG: ATP-binding protein [Halanaerobiales bacterium]